MNYRESACCRDQRKPVPSGEMRIGWTIALMDISRFTCQRTTAEQPAENPILRRRRTMFIEPPRNEWNSFLGAACARKSRIHAAPTELCRFFAGFCKHVATLWRGGSEFVFWEFSTCSWSLSCILCARLEGAPKVQFIPAWGHAPGTRVGYLDEG